ncbi:hypothetical protein ALQ88_200116 [Pseudomonas savastanoi]|nr:hypothetical protein ALQ88_200116 [Pseudomonas savastanoi]
MRRKTLRRYLLSGNPDTTALMQVASPRNLGAGAPSLCQGSTYLICAIA